VLGTAVQDKRVTAWKAIERSAWCSTTGVGQCVTISKLVLLSLVHVLA
jgi:hypothetical protein